MPKQTIEQRRKLAASVPLPPVLASKFTPAQLAVLSVISEEIARQSVWDLSIDVIAARAGTSRSTTQCTLRDAKRLGLITVQERRHSFQPSATNIIQWAVSDGAEPWS
jgi:hypothetical protein